MNRDTMDRMALWIVGAVLVHFLLQALLPVLVCGLVGWAIWRWVNRR